MAREDRCAMSFADVVTAADMIVASGRFQMGILGGEPTLHPQFTEIILYLMSRKIRLTVFTNGAGGTDRLEELSRLKDNTRLKFVVNVNFPGIDSEDIRTRQEDFLRRFAAICDVGLTFYQPGLDPMFLVDTIQRIGLKGTAVRVGLAQPAKGQKSDYLQLQDYPGTIERIINLAERVFDRDMRVSLDCGFPLCLFTNEQLGRLVRCNASLKFACQPIVDIGPGLQTWACFPLSTHARLTIDRKTRLKDVVDHFDQMRIQTEKTAGMGIFPQCEACAYMKHGACDGGCFAHRLGAG